MKCNSRPTVTRANTVGWGSSEPAGFGQSQDQSIKNKLINLISAIRTLLRSEYERVKGEGVRSGVRCLINVILIDLISTMVYV